MEVFGEDAAATPVSRRSGQLEQPAVADGRQRPGWQIGRRPMVLVCARPSQRLVRAHIFFAICQYRQLRSYGKTAGRCPLGRRLR